MTRATDQTLEEYAQALQLSSEFRVLRRAHLAICGLGGLVTGDKVAAVIDTETTGLDTTEDEIVEFAATAFSYGDDGEITGIGETYEGLREPRRRIPPEVTRITGIRAEDVAGRSIPESDVLEFMNPVGLIIAHNAAFDRPMVERTWPRLRNKPWACSATEIDWMSLGFEGRSLGYLLTQAGYFHDGHRARDDCHALLVLMKRAIAQEDSLGMKHILRSARQTRFEIIASAGYEKRDLFKSRGYKWNPGSSGSPRGWRKEFSEEASITEISFIKQQDVDVHVRRLTAFDRYRETISGSRTNTV